MTYSDRFTRKWAKSLVCPYGPYRGVVTGVHDGDTITVLLDAGFNLLTEVQLRIYSIQAPELYTGSETDKQAGRAARDYLRQLLPDGQQVRITTLLATTGEQSRTFTRYVAQVEFGEGRDVATDMVSAGHAFWCDRNLNALPGPPAPVEHWVRVEVSGVK